MEKRKGEQIFPQRKVGKYGRPFSASSDPASQTPTGRAENLMNNPMKNDMEATKPYVVRTTVSLAIVTTFMATNEAEAIAMAKAKDPRHEELSDGHLGFSHGEWVMNSDPLDLLAEFTAEVSDGAIPRQTVK
jgi:hypothetical protein